MKKLNIAVDLEEKEKIALSELFSYLESIQNKIPRALKEIEKGTYGESKSTTAILIGKLIRTSQENWYETLYR